MKRREFIRYLGAGTVGVTLPLSLWADRGGNDDGGDGDGRKGKQGKKPKDSNQVPGSTGASGRVVIVGGGMGGATVAKYLRLWGGKDVQVTLVEANAKYYSCILSNLVVTGQRGMAQLTFDYNKLVSSYGVKFVHAQVKSIDAAAQKLTLSNGSQLAYDKLVLSPGIEFDVIPGLESAAAQKVIPHAWKAGAQTLELKKQLVSMPAGGTYVLSIPAAPYRCPPGPYERACIVADYLKKKKPGSKVIVLDANPGIMAEKTNFTHAFNVIHKGVIEYYSSAEVWSIDPSTRTLDTAIGNIKGNVVNAIPPQRAGRIVTQSGLATDNRWAGVDMRTYESLVAQNVYVIGDSSATTQPKAGHIANAEAKVCADAIIRALKGGGPDPAPVTNSSCFTPITMSTASWLSVVYKYDPASATMKPVGGGATEASQISSSNFRRMLSWFDNLMSDTFA